VTMRVMVVGGTRVIGRRAVPVMTPPRWMTKLAGSLGETMCDRYVFEREASTVDWLVATMQARERRGRPRTDRSRRVRGAYRERRIEFSFLRVHGTSSGIER
jgi:hypothetical protein